MKLNRILENRDPLEEWFQREYVSVDYAFDNIDMSDGMDDAIAAGIDDILSNTKSNLYFPKELLPALKKAIENDSSVQAIDMLRGHLTTFEDWKDSPDGEEAMYQMADQADYESDPYKYHGVRRSDF